MHCFIIENWMKYGAFSIGETTFLGFSKKQKIFISLAFECLKTSIRNQSQ